MTRIPASRPRGLLSLARCSRATRRSLLTPQRQDWRHHHRSHCTRREGRARAVGCMDRKGKGHGIEMQAFVVLCRKRNPVLRCEVGWYNFESILD